MDKTKQYELGDRISCKNWENLLATGLILKSKGYGVNVIGRKDMMNDVLTITALPEDENGQISDESDGAVKEPEPCDTCGYEEGSRYCKEHCPYEAKIEQEHCEDAISRQAVLERIKREEEILYTPTGMNYLIRVIKGIPPVTPQPKTGHWISHYDQDAKEGWYECDCCHTERAFNTKFCPDCGCRMVEPQEERERGNDETGRK